MYTELRKSEKGTIWPVSSYPKRQEKKRIEQNRTEKKSQAGWLAGWLVELTDWAHFGRCIYTRASQWTYTPTISMATALPPYQTRRFFYFLFFSFFPPTFSSSFSSLLLPARFRQKQRNKNAGLLIFHPIAELRPRYGNGPYVTNQPTPLPNDSGAASRARTALAQTANRTGPRRAEPCFLPCPWGRGRGRRSVLHSVAQSNDERNRVLLRVFQKQKVPTRQGASCLST